MDLLPLGVGYLRDLLAQDEIDKGAALASDSGEERPVFSGFTDEEDEI